MVMKTKYACYNYITDQFVWIGLISTFVIGTKDIEFHNSGKQFYIHNPITKNSRRFRLCIQRKNHFLFKSEDGIKCIVLKNVNFV